MKRFMRWVLVMAGLAASVLAVVWLLKLLRMLQGIDY